MLLIVLSTAALTESSQGNARGASAARIKATAMRAATIRARTGQVQAPQEALSGRGQGMGTLSMRGREMATQAEMRSMATNATSSGATQESELGEPKGLMQAKVVTPQEPRAVLLTASEQVPPLPPKRARAVPLAPGSNVPERQPEQPAEHQETWGEMFSRHGETLMSHLGAD